MIRILHVASVPETLRLFCKPFELRAEGEGIEFSYLDGTFFVPSLLGRGYAAVRTWTHGGEVLSHLRDLDPAIVQVHTPATALALRWALPRLGASLIYVARGGLNEGRSPVESRVFERLDPMYWRAWSHVAVVNRTRLRAVRGRVNTPASLVSAGGVPAPEVVDPAEEPPEGLELLWVGRLTEDKQPEVALTVVRRLRELGLPVRITFVGGALDGDRPSVGLAETISGTSFTTATGWVDDVASFYRLAQLLLVTSRREGYGRTPLEAAAFGVPTVGFVTEGTRESVPDAGGVLVPQGDVDAMVDEVRRYFEGSHEYRRSLRRRAISAARKMEAVDVWSEWRGIYATLT